MGEDKNTTDLSGVAGFFNDYQASRPPNTQPVRIQKPKPTPVKAKPSPKKKTSEPKTSKTVRQAQSAPIKARQGRPPGVKPKTGPVREKVTIYVSKDLMNEFRERSWDERKNIGVLVESALIDYKERNFKDSQ